MAPGTPHDCVVFLFQCIKHSKGKIDFKKVGSAVDTTYGAARMKYKRIEAKLHANRKIAATHEDVVFLLRCLHSSDFQIDFNAVGRQLNTTYGAARMKYVRLKDKIGINGDTVERPAGVTSITPPKSTSSGGKAKKRTGSVDASLT